METNVSILVASLLFAASPLTSQAGPIGKGGFVITKPGKYTLIRDIRAVAPSGTSDGVGIMIKASNVELDLGGFTIGPVLGQDGKGIGILINEGVRNVRIHNGRVRDFEFGVFGSAGSGAALTAGVIERLQINDCAQTSISLSAASCVIRGCAISGPGNGIQVLTAIDGYNEVSGCTVIGPSMGTGITDSGLIGLLVRGCVVQGLQIGIEATAGAKLFDNVTLGCTKTLAGNATLVGVND